MLPGVSSLWARIFSVGVEHFQAPTSTLASTVMQFTFWATVNNTEVKLHTTNLLEAAREAKKLGATACRGINPNGKASIAIEVR
jgi:hypothetical protein